MAYQQGRGDPYQEQIALQQTHKHAPFSTLNPLNLSAPCWHYIDDDAAVQGPFTSKEMDKWYQDGYFHMKLMLAYKRTVMRQDYVRMDQFIQNPGLLFNRDKM